LDTVKVRIQTDRSFTSALQCAVHIARHEGFFGFYRGLLSPIINLAITNTLSFTLYGAAKHSICGSDQSHPQYLPRTFIAGAFVGFALGGLTTPFELAKVQSNDRNALTVLQVRVQIDRLAKSGSVQQYRGSLDCAMQIWRSNGLASLYTGFIINTLREGVFCTFYFGVYETLKAFSSSRLDPNLTVLASGAVAGIAGWTSSYPLDVIKSLVQTKRLGPPSPSTSAWSLARERWAAMGLRGFYVGLMPSVIRAALVSSTRFYAFEFVKALITGKQFST
jgi:solute carrier family 25 (mitochondrial carnitine/acylcarnitine transporter), member 20/29